MLNTGTKVNQLIRPKGFGGRLNKHARGHLLAEQLGRSGDDIRNLTTLYQNPVNTPIMRGFENKVKLAVQNGGIVKYSVKPVYDGEKLIPKAVTMEAKGNKGFSLGVSILNIRR